MSDLPIIYLRDRELDGLNFEDVKGKFDFTGANLMASDLTKANLTDGDFTDAILTDEILRE